MSDDDIDGKACPFPFELRILFWSLTHHTHLFLPSHHHGLRLQGFHYSFLQSLPLSPCFSPSLRYFFQHPFSLSAFHYCISLSLLTLHRFSVHLSSCCENELLKVCFFPGGVQVRGKKRERGHLGCYGIALNFGWTELKPTSASERRLMSKFRFFCFRFLSEGLLLEACSVALKRVGIYQKQLFLKNIYCSECLFLPLNVLQVDIICK